MYRAYSDSGLGFPVLMMSASSSAKTMTSKAALN